MKNPSWWENPPEDPPEDDTDIDLNWNTPQNAPYTDRDCDYWERLFNGEKNHEQK